MFLPSYIGAPIWWHKILFYQRCMPTNLHMIPLSLLMIALVLVHEHAISFLHFLLIILIHIPSHILVLISFLVFFFFLLWNSNFLYSEMFIRNWTKNNHDWTECIVTCSHRFHKICVPLFPRNILVIYYLCQNFFLTSQRD